jgi:signal transduction histidine kinase
MTERVVRWAISLALVLLVVVSAVQIATDADGPSNVGWFALCVLIAWAAIDRGVWASLILLLASWGALTIAWLAFSEEGGWAPWYAGTLFAWVVSLLVRREQVLTAQLRAAQAELADQARAEERHRIAREMHDVIGHALTVSLLHVTSARLAVEEDPAEAIASLAEAERLAQRSLAEVRTAVGLMREGGGGAAAPMPGIGDVEELVESFRNAGTPVTYVVRGDLSRLTATTGLAAYRILQEALTNVARHAPGRPADIEVVVDGGTTRITVDNPAPGRALATADGTGLLGMRERAEALGGRLDAGANVDRWRVEAVLPG